MLDFLIPAAHAQQQGAPGAPSLLANLLPIIILIPLFYFLLIRPQMKRSRETREMLAKLAKGDEVVTAGGLAGRITAIGESYVTLEVAEGVEVKAQKSAISSVLPKGTLKTL
ncbi:MAG: preprotein translocase subunit YajC [Sinobacteraceae bacterium]|nr:preprotein translocase subunit YajC [Nevskiaceae bacterium]